MPLLQNLRFLVRHPRLLLPLAAGMGLPDLALREDLRRLGIPLGLAAARGLASAHLSVRVVELLRKHFTGAPPRTVLDVGAAHGGYSLAALLAFPDTRVYSFEPLPEVFRVLEQTAAGRGRITPFPLALGEAEARVTIHRSESTGSSSILSMRSEHEAHFPGTGTIGSEEIEVRTLDALVAAGEVDLTPPVLMKIDVQGYEDRVLAGAAATLPRINALIVELSLTELYEGQQLLPELRSRIEGQGFTFRGNFTEGRSETSGEIVQVDALFTR
jgi:FkbM family methyltransferase